MRSCGCTACGSVASQGFLDHSMLSQSGKVSKRAREAAQRRYGEKVAEWWEKNHPRVEPDSAAVEIAQLKNHLARMEDFIARGYRVRLHKKEAAKAREEIRKHEHRPH